MVPNRGVRPNNKGDWEFQENVLIAEHVAITRGTEISDWVWLMVSKQSFQQNIRIEAKIKLGDSSNGLGFLMCVPEAQLRTHINDGYSLWLGTEQNRSTKLLRSTVEVVQTPDVFLKRNEWVNLRIEKIENNIYVYINGLLQFSYISHMPIVGTHIGLLARDDDYEIKDFHVYVASQSVMVNCLSVPDAFLAQKQYDIALSEYRRIGYSFPGRAEGREAMFRAGITLLEQASDCKDKALAEILYDQSQAEFEKLHSTPGAPFEYLGKALVYQALNDYDEEIKCFELACGATRAILSYRSSTNRSSTACTSPPKSTDPQPTNLYFWWPGICREWPLRATPRSSLTAYRSIGNLSPSSKKTRTTKKQAKSITWPWE